MQQTDLRIWTKPARQADVVGRGMEKEEVMLTTHVRNTHCVYMGGLFTWEWEAKVCELSYQKILPFFSIHAHIHGRTFHIGVRGEIM